MDHFLVESPVSVSPDHREARFPLKSTVPTIEEELPETEDIYRGEPPSPPKSPPPRQPSPAPSSSPSSSGWSGLGLRRGTLAAVLELAINRWARATSGSSTSSSSSSASLRSSVHTRKPRFRRRRPSVSTSINTYSEDFIRARRRAREVGRTLPREFTLFLPVALTDGENDKIRDIYSSSSAKDSRLFRASSLPLVLHRLDSAIKQSNKLRRPGRCRSPSPGKALDVNETFNRRQYEIGLDVKGKSTRKTVPSKIPEQAKREKSQPQPAWWLDVSSPSWSDMREIGKLLHLHPLTLEDILHQETREKVELFPRLGYYFVVFRALESEFTRAKTTQLALLLDDKITNVTEDTIGATNLYIVVFRDGICTFHFEDISDHTQRVQHRIIQFEETFHMSSDWIAHGILDSIMDQYFPLLEKIEHEVKDLDDLVLSIDGPVRDGRALLKPIISIKTPLREDANETDDKKAMFEDREEKISSLDEKPVFETSDSGQRCSIMNYTRIIGKLAMLLTRQPATKKEGSSSVMAPSPLMRMASARKLVTSLSRLLGTKSEVISQMRKHLGSNAGFGSSEQTLVVDVGLYLDDIQDHILTLNQSLTHYERMLSHSQPAYLSQLRVAMSRGKQNMDSALLKVTVISIGVMLTQIITGVFSVNLKNIPRNLRVRSAPFNVFVIIVVTILLAMVAFVGVCRYWWLKAKRKYARHSRGY